MLFVIYTNINLLGTDNLKTQELQLIELKCCPYGASFYISNAVSPEARSLIVVLLLPFIWLIKSDSLFKKYKCFFQITVKVAYEFGLIFERKVLILLLKNK